MNFGLAHIFALFKTILIDTVLCTWNPVLVAPFIQKMQMCQKCVWCTVMCVRELRSHWANNFASASESEFVAVEQATLRLHLQVTRRGRRKAQLGIKPISFYSAMQYKATHSNEISLIPNWVSNFASVSASYSQMQTQSCLLNRRKFTCRRRRKVSRSMWTDPYIEYGTWVYMES